MPINESIAVFARKLPVGARVLDIGCGFKPYKELFKGEYVGIDYTADSEADIVCDSAHIPLPDSQFDAIICTQTLPHVPNLLGTVAEMKRLLKPGGLAFVSVPFGIKTVAEVEPIDKAPLSNFSDSVLSFWRQDFWRFTQCGLVVLFKDFTIVWLKPMSGYAGTLLQGINYFLASLRLKYVFVPIFFINNILGLSADGIAKLLFSNSKISIIRRFYRDIYLSWPLNYVVILKK